MLLLVCNYCDRCRAHMAANIRLQHAIHAWAWLQCMEPPRVDVDTPVSYSFPTRCISLLQIDTGMGDAQLPDLLPYFRAESLQTSCICLLQIDTGMGDAQCVSSASTDSPFSHSLKLARHLPTDIYRLTRAWARRSA